MAPQPTRKVKVKLQLRVVPAVKAGKVFSEELGPGVLVEQVLEIDVPISVSDAQCRRDARFIMAVDRAQERMMDEYIQVISEIIKDEK
jgi:hypothetical protein